ncbi:hypothetical protein GGI05_000516, partial [Coemansia sp. RSA 2603]
MSQPQNREGDRATGPTNRPMGSTGQAMEPPVAPKETRTRTEGAAGKPGVAVVKSEVSRQEDEHMAKMERRMDDICALLRDLMVVRQVEQYYAEVEATPTPTGSGGRFPQQERPLYSTPSGALREHNYP